MNSNADSMAFEIETNKEQAVGFSRLKEIKRVKDFFGYELISVCFFREGMRGGGVTNVL